MAVGIKYGSETIFTPYSTVELKPGMNTIEISNLYAFNWSRFKYIERIKLAFGDYEDAARDYIYLADMSVYMK